MRQVLLIQPYDPFSWPAPSAVLLVVIKKYDPRFFEDRQTCNTRPVRSWTYGMKAASSEQGRGNSLPECDQDLQPSICVDDDDPVGWEEWYFQYAKHPLFSEREAYSLCVPLQGTSVPRWLGSGRSSLMDHGPRAITPCAFFLEYTPDPVSLGDLTDPQLFAPPLVRPLIEGASAFATSRIAHQETYSPASLLALLGRSSLTMGAAVYATTSPTKRGRRLWSVGETSNG